MTDWELFFVIMHGALLLSVVAFGVYAAVCDDDGRAEGVAKKPHRIKPVVAATTQTAKQSAREALSNTASAFVLSWAAHIWAVAPVVRYFGLDYGAVWTAFGITIFYTALSLGRNFAVRRFFAGKGER